MSIATITRAAMAGALALAALNGVAIWAADRAAEDERTAVSRSIEFRKLSGDLRNASLFLTEEARRYAVFGDERHFAAYWREVKETKTGEAVVRRLKELDALPQELALIEQAKANSDALIATEDAAMKAVAVGDLARAQRLMFGPDYDSEQAKIMAPIDQFQRQINERAEAEALSARNRAEWMTMAANASVALSAAAFLAILWLVVGGRVVRPLQAMTAAMGKLAAGDKTIEIPGVGRKDEIGAMAGAVQVFKDTAIEAERMAAEEKTAQAERERRAAKVDELTQGFDRSVSAVLETVTSATTELQATAGSMTATAEETSRQSIAVAAASEQASTNVQTVASAAEELSSSISEISRQVQQSAQVAGRAADDAARTNGTVKTLAEAAQKIGHVVSLINDIAGQTNLLALNATIEAARAGEAGKGFAVVASEVKSLANQTAKATEEIGAQISAMQNVTGEAVSAITSISATIGEINQIATAIASAVEEQGAATQEIARNVQQAAVGTQQVSSNIAGVQQAASDTGAASQQVLGASGELAQQSELLRRQLDDFLAEVRAA